MGQVVAFISRGDGIELGLFLCRQLGTKQRHVVLFLVGLIPLTLPDFVDHPLENSFQLFLGAIRVDVVAGVIGPVVGVTVAGDEAWATAGHHADLAFARGLETLRQVQLLEQRTDRIRHVLDDLASVEDLGGWSGFPDHLDGLYRQVGDGA